MNIFKTEPFFRNTHNWYKTDDYFKDRAAQAQQNRKHRYFPFTSKGIWWFYSQIQRLFELWFTCSFSISPLSLLQVHTFYFKYFMMKSCLGDAFIFSTIIVSFLVTVLAEKIKSSSLFFVFMLLLAVQLVSTMSFILWTTIGCSGLRYVKYLFCSI